MRARPYNYNLETDFFTLWLSMQSQQQVWKQVECYVGVKGNTFLFMLIRDPTSSPSPSHLKIEKTGFKTPLTVLSLLPKTKSQGTYSLLHAGRGPKITWPDMPPNRNTTSLLGHTHLKINRIFKMIIMEIDMLSL